MHMEGIGEYYNDSTQKGGFGYYNAYTDMIVGIFSIYCVIFVVLMLYNVSGFGHDGRHGTVDSGGSINIQTIRISGS